MGQVSDFLDYEGVACHCVPLGGEVQGVVYCSKRGRYHIFIDDSLSREAMIKTFLHEIHHIKNDIPNIPYVIGVDFQREPLEQTADKFSREFFAKLLG